MTGIRTLCGMVAMKEVVYAIDRGDLIVEVNEGWEEFARLNSSEAVAGGQVLGRSLWEFMADATTTALYQLMVRRIRDGGPPVAFNFRCDAAARRRLLCMQLTAGHDGGVTFRVNAVQEEDRPEVPFLARHAPVSQGLTTVCSWCERVRLPTDEWVGAEQAMEWRTMHVSEQDSGITHGICPSCRETMFAQLERPDSADPGRVSLGDFR